MRPIRTVAVTWLAAALMGAPAEGASFACAKAKTPLEHRICADPELSRLDDDLGAAYRKAFGSLKPHEFVRETQRVWLREVADCVTFGRKDAVADKSCADQYRARIDRLTAYLDAEVYGDSSKFDPENATLLVYDENGTRWLEWFGHWMPDAYRPEPYPNGFLAYDRDKIVARGDKLMLDEHRLELRLAADKIDILGDGISLSARQGPIVGAFRRIR